jgi:hypothetical protein
MVLGFSSCWSFSSIPGDALSEGFWIMGSSAVARTPWLLAILGEGQRGRSLSQAIIRGCATIKVSEFLPVKKRSKQRKIRTMQAQIPVAQHDSGKRCAAHFCIESFCEGAHLVILISKCKSTVGGLCISGLRALGCSFCSVFVVEVGFSTHRDRLVSDVLRNHQGVIVIVRFRFEDTRM